MRNLGSIPELKDHVTVGIDEVPAVGATEKGASDEDIRIREGMSAIELLRQSYLAAWAGELGVEQLLRFGRTLQSIFVPFNSFPCQEWI